MSKAIREEQTISFQKVLLSENDVIFEKCHRVRAMIFTSYLHTQVQYTEYMK